MRTVDEIKRLDRIKRRVSLCFAGVLVVLAVVNGLCGNLVASLACSATATWIVAVD